MRKWFTLIDNISNEIKDYNNRSECLEEAERRLSVYRNGYDVGNRHVGPVNAVLIENGSNYIVTYGGSCNGHKDN